MRLVTLKEISAMEPGEICPGFRAQIKEVKQQKTGKNDHGPWTLQSLTLMDSTAVIQVKLFDAPEYTAQWVGAWIVVESTLNQHGKLAGILVSTYRDKKEIHVKVNGGAVITQAPDATPTAAEPAKMPPPQQAPAPTQQTPPPQQAQPPTQTAAPAKQPAPKQTAEKPDEVRQSITAAKKRLGQAANGMIMAYDAAIHIANTTTEKHPEIGIPLFGPDQLQKIAVSLWIYLDRGGLLLGLPVGKLDPWTKKNEPDHPVQSDDAAQE